MHSNTSGRDCCGLVLRRVMFPLPRLSIDREENSSQFPLMRNPPLSPVQQILLSGWSSADPTIPAYENSNFLHVAGLVVRFVVVTLAAAIFDHAVAGPPWTFTRIGMAAMPVLGQDHCLSCGRFTAGRRNVSVIVARVFAVLLPLSITGTRRHKDRCPCVIVPFARIVPETAAAGTAFLVQRIPAVQADFHPLDLAELAFHPSCSSLSFCWWVL